MMPPNALFGIAGERLVVGLGDRGGHRRSAGVLVLQDHHGGLVELTHERPARVGVEQVVVGELLAVELFGVDQAVRLGELVEAVERRLLMRVLTVAQALLLDQVQVDRVGHLVGQAAARVELLSQPAGDRAVVGVGGPEHLERQLAAGLERGGAAVGAHLLEDGIVAGGVGDHGDRRVVLGGGAQHGRAADVDVLDAGVEVGAAGDRLLEGVEVHDHHVDHLDAVLVGLGHVLRVVALGQKAAVHHGVQGLDAAVHHLGELRHLVDRGDRHAAFRDGAGGAARRDDLGAELIVQRTREFDDARLVGDGHENALHFGIFHDGCKPPRPITHMKSGYQP